MGRGNCPSSGLLLSGVVVVRGSCPGGDDRSPGYTSKMISVLLYFVEYDSIDGMASFKAQSFGALFFGETQP